jgi:predicted solute-binding protein
VFYMKFSKSILVFLFVSSTLRAFYYALKRTDGNVCQSIMFTVYFLAIKIGLIGPNIAMALDQDDSNQQQLVVKNRVLPSYHLYISASDNYYYRPSRLYMGKTEMLRFVPEYSHSAKSISEIRAGGRLSDAAFLFALLYIETPNCWFFTNKSYIKATTYLISS